VERGFGLGEARLFFFLGNCRVWLGIDALFLLAAKPSGGIDIYFGEWSRRVFLGGAGAAVRDQAFDGHDHGEGFDLAGDAATGHLGAHLRDFPEAIQNLFAAQILPALSLRFLIEDLFGDEVTDFVFWHTWLLGVEKDCFAAQEIRRERIKNPAGAGWW
jgi:hypothetical protein